MMIVLEGASKHGARFLEIEFNGQKITNALMNRPTFASLSAHHLIHNIHALKTLAPHSRLMGIVKANAYGHGLTELSQRIESQVDGLGVACLEEAITLRRAGIEKPIMLMEGIFHPDELDIAARLRLSIVVHHGRQAQWLKEAVTLPSRLSIWIKIDTGMHRLGFSPEETHRIYRMLQSNRWIEQPIGFLAHFACADEPNHPKNQQQMDVFFDLHSHYAHIPYSFCNSSALCHFPQVHGDWIRCGLLMYGAYPSSAFEHQIFKPVMHVQSCIVAERSLKKGESIGYGATYCCPTHMRIGIVPIGYGDGYPLTARTGTPVLVQKQICSLVGRVSMDRIAIVISHCPDAQIGSPVTLWGDELPVHNIAEYSSTIAWSVLTGLQSRVRRIWMN